MMDLFDSFKSDSQNLLIFLKNIENIKLYKRCSGQSEAKLMFEVRLTPDSTDYVRSKRKEFLTNCDPSCTTQGQGTSLTYLVEVETIKHLADGSFEIDVFKWLVNEHRAGTNISTELQQLQNDPTLPLIPLVGVAMPIHTKKVGVGSDSQISGGQISQAQSAEGQVFCFLPLPVEQKTSTGIPVHVNGYFAISQNRRHLKWPTAGHNVKSDKSILWNQCIIKELIPVSYEMLLLEAIQICKSLMTIEDVYRAFPDIENVDEKWQIFLETLYEELFKQPVVFTECEGGKWVNIEHVLFDRMDEQETTKSVITKVCLLSGENIARVPEHILHAFGAYTQHSIYDISPSRLRAILRHSPDAYQQLGRPDKLLLLMYILKDQDFQDLKGMIS